jgi:hypothetical protein
VSKFQSIISTIAALGTIAVTSVTAYKVFESQQVNSTKQQTIIEDLKRQLLEKKVEAEKTTPTMAVPAQTTAPDPLAAGSASAPPLPPLTKKPGAQSPIGVITRLTQMGDPADPTCHEPSTCVGAAH